MAGKKPTPKRRNALGRGLGALLDDSAKSIIPEASSTEILSPNVGEILVEQITANPFQPRIDFDEEALAELSESIKLHGIIQPITVRKVDSNSYQLISGERRLHATKRAGRESIPAFIRTADDQQMLEMALIENIQRENLNAIEIALSFQRLLSECQLKQEELGDRVGKKRATVNNYLRLLKLPPDIQIALRDNKISMGHARAIINVDDVTVQLVILQKIISQDLSVRQVEGLVRSMTSASKSSKIKKEADTNPELTRLQKTLTTHFGSKIAVSSKDGKKGEIKIPFRSVDDLNRILDLLDL